jgi:hypothetical protein
MENVIDRLRKSKEASAEEDRRSGMEAGTEWAKKEAEWRCLVALNLEFGSADDSFWDEVGSDSDVAERIVSVLDDDGYRPDWDRVKECWEAIAGINADKVTAAFARGFVEGAIEIFNTVKDKV